MTTGADPSSASPIQLPDEIVGRFAQADVPVSVAQDIYSDPSTVIPLKINLPDVDSAEYKFIMISGLPDKFRMSSGFPTKNAWLVSVRDVPNLTIFPKNGFIGQFVLRVLLITEGNKSEEQRVTVNILPKGDQRLKDVSPTVAATSSTSPKAETEPLPAAPDKRQLSEERENASMDRATEFLANADISAARLIYETLAMKGSARAAFAMGQTFDPEFLAGKRIEGLKPDIERARNWYKKAIALGSEEAQARLAALDGG